jgi:holo-[acyl-carrier protein] synthase
VSDLQRENGRTLGIGVDLIEIERIKIAYQRFGDAFLQKVYSFDEIQFCFLKQNPFPSLAARFAAKEAGFKALSQAGFPPGHWRELTVRQNAEGIPDLVVPGLRDAAVHLSLSHTSTLAIATVVIERRN